MQTILIGASGLLGRHLNIECDKPSHNQLDITDISSVMNYRLSNLPWQKTITTIILLAAYTNVAKSNIEKDLVYKTNCLGVKNVISFCKTFVDRPKLVYISTDYVFNGDKGNYKTTDSLDPVSNNYYAFSKALGETMVSQYEQSQIIRTSFCPSDKWPFPIAFEDQYTSRDTVDVIAPKITEVINNNKFGIFHVGTERKSVYELAKRINPNVLPGSRLNIKGVNIPFDTSLEINC